MRISTSSVVAGETAPQNRRSRCLETARMLSHVMKLSFDSTPLGGRAGTCMGWRLSFDVIGSTTTNPAGP